MQPTVRVGRSGITSGVIDEIKGQLKNRDAVKVKLLGADRGEVKEMAAELADRCNAELVEIRGNTLALWRK
ncbi:MAG: hypothetical protein AYK23_02015 [Candidatus Proteinoplasmatales archaeon SG8-5]|nr:MAG: hypothetical protein AYK23_02015 [Candidatus Proteinoplasmatales archaeon SG8-5]